MSKDPKRGRGRFATMCNRAPTVLTLLLGVCFAAHSLAQGREATVHVDEVRVIPVTQTTPVLGRIVARKAGPVASRVSAAVTKFEVDVGDPVEQGQVLVALDAERLSVNRDLAASRVDELHAKLDTARASLALARQETNRFDRLKRTQATAKAQFEDAELRQRVESAKVREAESALRSAETELRFSEIDLSHTMIRAPYAGTVVARSTESGAYVREGDVLLELVADGDLEVEAQVPSDRIGGLENGRKVELVLDDGTVHSAEVRAIVPRENRLTRTRAVRFTATFGKVSKPLASEQSVTVHVPLGASREALSVHKDAVTKRGTDSLVFVVVDGVAQIRKVKLGISIGGRFEVITGLKSGDLAVVRGNERLRPNDKVKIAINAPSLNSNTLASR